MNDKLTQITVYSVGHFYVDFICALIASTIIFLNPLDLKWVSGLIIIYNIIAFGTQPFFGFLVDHFKISKHAAIFGLIVATLGAVFFFSPLFSIVLLGIGNAIYHVGGGVVALNMTPSKAKYPGIYVAPGAIGLFLGGALGLVGINLVALLIGLVIITIVLTYAIHRLPKIRIRKYKEKKGNLFMVAMLLLLVSVCMRALIGYSLQIGWKSIYFLGLTLTLSIFLGKFMGGILADKYGFMKVGLIGLIIATPLLVFFQSIPAVVFIGAFCFNLVMPITLTAIAETMPNYKGVAFGLTTLSLISGFILFFVLKEFIIVDKLFTFIVIMINIGSLYFGLHKYEELKK